ncbi:DnaJ C-terminal domain-containing protein [Streptomyces mirabilis]|uniref:DnaJ C-terminal domain-containing protein n=1 Tax=Streptomyces mirabilis TaxID=68239 RepID=UPI0036B03C4D
MTEQPRRPVATYETYQEAERAVDHISDQGFPVQRVAIIGQDVRLVEHVIGRMDYGRAALHGAASGALPSALIGWLFGLVDWVDPPRLRPAHRPPRPDFRSGRGRAVRPAAVRPAGRPPELRLRPLGAAQPVRRRRGRSGRRRGGTAAPLTGPTGQPRRCEVDVPPGVTDGQRIRLAGEGGRGSGNAPAGDLYLRVRIQPHPRFRLDGRDVHVQVPVAPWEAALGATGPVPAPGGGTAKVTAPAGSSSSRRLRGEGMPNPRGANGDLCAELRMVVPPALGDRERELFEEFAATSSFDPRRTR